METIVALATPPGRSAIAVVRASGPEALLHLKRLCRAEDFVPRRARLANVIDPESGEQIDRCLVQFFPAPNSYTGEDVCELSCHGSPMLAGRLLESFLYLGARLAEPGEFTLRAFLNGKMDLAQAEAVRDLVEARTGYQARVAREQLEGKLSRTLQPVKERLVGVISLLETAVEFVEDDVGEISRAAQAEELQAICARLEEMESSYRFGKFIHDGFRMAIVGRPNVGKSSLFNALLQADRAIVTDIPGTTRDAITESIHIQGIPVRLTDTAGIRQSLDRVEQIGVERSQQAAGEADVLLVVLDASQPCTSEDRALLERLQRQPGIVVGNKMDLVEGARGSNSAAAAAGKSQQAIPSPESGRDAGERFLGVWGKECLGQTEKVEKSLSDHAATAYVSALTGIGVAELQQAIYDLLCGDVRPDHQGIIVTSLRHRDCMTRARAALQSGIETLREGLSEEFALYHIRRGLQILGEITGETTVEDILDKIFSTFCIGK